MNSVLILDGNSEIVAHTRSNICYLSCIRYLVRLREVKNQIFFFYEKFYYSKKETEKKFGRKRQRKNVEERDRERIWKKETEKECERKRQRKDLKERDRERIWKKERYFFPFDNIFDLGLLKKGQIVRPSSGLATSRLKILSYWIDQYLKRNKDEPKSLVAEWLIQKKRS